MERSIVTFEWVTKPFKEESFRKAFRMSRSSFYKLLALLQPLLEKDNEMGMRSGRRTVPADTRLGITLRLLTGAKYIDTMYTYRLESSTVYSIFHDTLHAIQNTLKLNGLPNDEEDLWSISNSFKRSRRLLSPLSGCVGALDGICVAIKKPKINPAMFFCRKGFHAIPVQALVDSSYRFRSMSARCVGSTNDALAHAVSELAVFLGSGVLGFIFWIVGDEAYSCCEWLITPYPNSQAGEQEKNFNVFLSSLRVHVEQAFGQLVARWSILNYKLEYSVGKSSRIVCVCMKLHNYCKDEMEKDFGKSLRNMEREDALAKDSSEWYKLAKETERKRSKDARNDVISHKRNALRDTVTASQKYRPRCTGAPC